MTFNIRALATGSTGNCYLIETDGLKFLIEVGIRWKQIQQALDYEVDDIAFAIITHSHGDHAKGVSDILKAGIPVYMSEATQTELELSHHRIKNFPERTAFSIQGLSFMAFPLEHDVSCHGFLIRNSEKETLLFITDSYYSRFRFAKIHYLMIEANYSEAILKQNVLDGKLHNKLRKRIMESHFSIENVKDFIQSNDTSELKQIWLLHLSGRNSDQDMFYREIASLTGKEVIIP